MFLLVDGWAFSCSFLAALSLSGLLPVYRGVGYAEAVAPQPAASTRSAPQVNGRVKDRALNAVKADLSTFIATFRRLGSKQSYRP